MKLKLVIPALLTIGIAAALPAQAFERLRPEVCPNGVELFDGASGSMRFGPSLDTYAEEAARQAGEVWADLDILERLEVAIGPFDRVHRRINEIAGSSAFIDFTLGPSVDPTLGLVELEGEIVDNGTSDVVFSEAPDDAMARTYMVIFDGNCRTLEADIVFFGAAEDWRFLEPEDYGTPYYDTAGAGQWVQTVYLHELLHALGLDHTPHAYTYLNYGRDLAWTKRDGGVGATPEPLPDERTALRDIYPATSSNEFDLLLTNTWFNDGPLYVVEGAALHQALCPPSKAGEDLANPGQFSAIEPLNAAWCSPQGGTTTVCPGQHSVAVAYAASNNGVVPEWVVHELWFSLDDELDTTVDIQSPDNFSWTESLGAYESSLNQRFFEVPAGLTANTDYHVIARVRRFAASLDQPTSQFRERSYRNNWIPLRGQIRASCN